MSVLSCSNITKTFILNTILDGISFTVEDGDKIGGVIGLNGSGKTTLLNILAGEINKDNGDIFVQKGLKIGYLKQHVKIDSTKTIYEDCLEVFQHLIQMEEDLRKLESQISMEGEKGESKRLHALMNKYGQLSEKFSSSNGYGYKSDIRGVLIGLGFSEDEFSKEVNLLSGGQNLDWL